MRLTRECDRPVRVPTRLMPAGISTLTIIAEPIVVMPRIRSVKLCIDVSLC